MEPPSPGELYHVVCRECPFERLIGIAGDADDYGRNHAADTGHRVVIDGSSESRLARPDGLERARSPRPKRLNDPQTTFESMSRGKFVSRSVPDSVIATVSECR
ncbi:hypothetical protein DJ79_06005 [Halorubrum ezzemoulense]|uniref:Uncharacterized protein n=1 Tax=Halorubrum ezzemoulense TaxID=337243 RepID=A0A256JHW1_HALEZ|nr:hypothetical protein DJ79_06005 [Halorubrum ezzemoulense]